MQGAAAGISSQGPQGILLSGHDRTRRKKKKKKKKKKIMVKLETAYRKLLEHGITLPDEVQGWFLITKFGLDSPSESMVLTATAGSLKKIEIVRAIKAIFLQGKGGAMKWRDVFVSEEIDNEPGVLGGEATLQQDDGEHDETQEIF